MIDFSTITGFEWDGGNARNSENKHRVSQSEAEQVFSNDPLIIVEDAGHSLEERRFNALGRSNEGRGLHLTFTLRKQDTVIRIISARPMNRKERDIYEKAS